MLGKHRAKSVIFWKRPNSPMECRTSPKPAMVGAADVFTSVSECPARRDSDETGASHVHSFYFPSAGVPIMCVYRVRGAARDNKAATEARRKTRTQHYITSPFLKEKNG